MRLYHYATQRFNMLKTLEQQRQITEEEKAAAQQAEKWGVHVGAYYQHVSFLLEPAPLDIIGNVFPIDHPVWKHRNTLFEYVVDSRHVEPFAYSLVEAPEKTEIYYDDTLDTEAYYRRYRELIKKHGWNGKGSAALEKAAKPYLGKTRDLYLAVLDRPNYEDLKYKYAATVPHVMLYPETGLIQYESVRKVKVR